jgi:cytochrome c
MSVRPFAVIHLGLGLLIGFAGSAAADDAATGATLVKKACTTCHALEAPAEPRQGPNLVGVFGRKAGTLPGFQYSAGFRAGAKDIVWDEANLDRWLTNPQAMIPGAVMLYKQAKPDKRRAIIAYLKTRHKRKRGRREAGPALGGTPSRSRSSPSRRR